MTNQEILQEIRAMAKGEPCSSQKILPILRRHGCDYLLSRVTDPSLKQQTLLQRSLNSIAIKERYKACTPLFAQSKIPYAVIKGAVLSQALYGDPLLRSSGDIDILIRREDADRIKQLLLSNGFIQGRVTDHGIQPFSRRELLFQTAMSHQTAPYIKETGNKLCPYVNLDVNMNILWGESEEKADMSLVLSHTQKSDLFGISFQKLTSEMEFISLCLHHYKDMNSLYLLTQGGLRLGLFCEIYDYLRNVHPDAEKLQSLCKQLNVGRYVYVCLYQTQKIFEDALLEGYLNALETQKDDSLLGTFGLHPSERREWKIDLFERLFHPNLPRYLLEQFTQKEKDKIMANFSFM